jgi:hypothetical protein
LRGDAAEAGAGGNLDDFEALEIDEIDRPVVHPVGPVLGQAVLGDDAGFVLANFV